MYNELTGQNIAFIKNNIVCPLFSIVSFYFTADYFICMLNECGLFLVWHICQVKVIKYLRYNTLFIGNYDK